MKVELLYFTPIKTMINYIYPLIVNKKTLEAVHKLELEVEA